MIKKISLIPIILCVSVSVLTGCATTPGKKVIPKGGDMTMEQIYRHETGHQDNEGQSESFRQARQAVHSVRHQSNNGSQSKGYDDGVWSNMRRQTQTLNNQFKSVPNPRIPMYIYPHVVHSNGETYPKPGMTTEFYLYKQNHIAMPGEQY